MPTRETWTDERQTIIDAAYRCLDRNAGESLAIGEILAEAGMSTRAFYRHFGTKNELILEMFRRDRERVIAELRQVVARAETPVQALADWMSFMLTLMTDRRKRGRVASFYSDEIRRTPGYTQEVGRFMAAEQAAIAGILYQGVADGTFLACTPEADSRTIRAALEAAYEEQLDRSASMSVAETVSQLLGFVLRGLGADTDQ